MKTIQHRLAEREYRFLQMVETSIYGHAQSPYLPLLKAAGCDIRDIRALVKNKGLEPALHVLRESGVYLAYEEFKGRLPVKRGGVAFSIQPGDLDNPHLQRSITRSTSGTTGTGVRVTMSIDHIAATSPYQQIFESGLEILDQPHLLWLQGFPGFLGPEDILRILASGGTITRWFTPLPPEKTRQRVKHVLAREAFLRLLASRGHTIPRPEPVSMQQPHKVTEAVHSTLRAHGRCSLRTYVGLALRVCIAAKELGLDLSGCTFIISGEPITPAKANRIKEVGGRVAARYAMTEASLMGLGCLNGSDPSDVHLLTDSLALIQNNRAVGEGGVNVETFSLTSLLPSAPKIMLNVEIDDYGIVEKRSCGCLWEKLGLTTHLRDIFSFSKLTGQGGVTLVGTDALHVLEEVFPSTFGGTPLDYQIREEEDEQGQTRISLVIDPHLHLPDPEVVVDLFLSALEGDRVADPGTSRFWREAKAVRLVRERPASGGRGKIMPLHRVGRTSAP